MTLPSPLEQPKPKALSVRQPWAWLIVRGFKPVENRTWHTRYRGRFFVHAGQAFDRDGYAWIVASGLAPAAFPSPGSFELGGVIGAVTLIECSPRGSRKGGPFRDPEQFGFLLADPVRIPFRRCRGALGFFDL